MAYEIYITDALVCGSRNNNTSDRSYLLFTREAGMVWASVKSVREERSKHRYALQDFSRARVSLVRGRNGWKITGTEPIASLYHGATDRERRIAVRDGIRLLRRFMHGETPAPSLFDDFMNAFSADMEHGEHLSLVVNLRVLHALGYVSPKPAFRPLIEASSILEACSLVTKENKKESDEAIEQAFDVSHL